MQQKNVTCATGKRLNIRFLTNWAMGIRRISGSGTGGILILAGYTAIALSRERRGEHLHKLELLSSNSYFKYDDDNARSLPASLQPG